MIVLKGSRVAAISVIAILIGWWESSATALRSAHYTQVSCQDLLKELAARYNHGVAATITATLFVVLMLVVAVDLLSAAFERVGTLLLGPAPGAQPPAGPPAAAA